MDSRLKNKKTFRDDQGNASIELAILMPVFILLVLGALEFGLDFVREEIVNNAVSTVSMALQRNPTYYQQPNSQLNALLTSYGNGIVKFSPVNTNTTKNYICVDTYTTQALAEAAPTCTNTHFNTSNPNGVGSTTPYYVAVRSNLAKGTITPLGNFIPVTKNIQINQSSGLVQVNSDIPPICNSPGDVLQYDSTTGKFICANILPPNCSQPWQRLVYNGNAFQCVNVPYVIAGGTAWPTTTNNPKWFQDSTWAGTFKNYTICQPNVRFTIPSGLPAGQILMQGNLIYPEALGGDGWWHSWTVSFVNTSFPIRGGTGKADVCMSNGGDFVPGTMQPPYIYSEQISWTVTFVPSR